MGERRRVVRIVSLFAATGLLTAGAWALPPRGEAATGHPPASERAERRPAGVPVLPPAGLPARTGVPAKASGPGQGRY